MGRRIRACVVVLVATMAAPLGVASVAWACAPDGWGYLAPPTITSPANNSYDTNGSFSVAGTAGPGSTASPEPTVRLYEGTTLRGTGTVTGSGAWSVALAGVPDGRHSYTARRTDAANNTSSASTALTVIVDKRKPRVRAVAPTAGATGVATTANVLARFSEPMRASTLTETTVKLVREGTRSAISSRVTYDATGWRSKLDPTRALAPRATYTATVNIWARDQAGNPLAQRKSWSFRTR